MYKKKLINLFRTMTMTVAVSGLIFYLKRFADYM